MTKSRCSILIGIALLAFTSSCISTNISMDPRYGFKFRGNERVTATVKLDGQINSYWTKEFADYLSKNDVFVEDFTLIQDLMYSHLIQSEALDSLALVKLGKTSNLDYLILSSFGEPSENTGLGFEILSPHDLRYHDNDFNRWSTFHINIWDLKSGMKVLSLTGKTNSSGIGYGGNSSGLSETRFF